MKMMTVKQIKNACKKHKYILLRFKNGYQMGLNTKMSKLAMKRYKYNDTFKTDFISYLPCNFQTYISHKHPFIK